MLTLSTIATAAALSLTAPVQAAPARSAPPANRALPDFRAVPEGGLPEAVHGVWLARGYGLLAELGPEPRLYDHSPAGTLLANFDAEELLADVRYALEDGGDVLQVERHVLVGLSERTNLAGAEQLGAILESIGMSWTPVPVAEGLHFKSSVNEVGECLLVTSEFAHREELAGYEKIIVPDDEAYAANTLRINDHLIMPAGYPKTRCLLEPLGLPITELDLSEMRKMDGGLTCLSLRL